MPREGTSKKKYKKEGKRRKAKATLSADDIDYLKKNTRYDEQEIKEWYRGFKQDCPDGQLSKEKILEMYTMILPAGNAKVFVEQIFRIFDKDGNGSIDFKEFMLATDMTASGSPEEKLRWAFKMYDKDGSGSIELKEMTEIIGTLYQMEGVAKESAADRAQSIFSTLDFDGDGSLTEDEFIRGCMQDEDLVGFIFIVILIVAITIINIVIVFFISNVIRGCMQDEDLIATLNAGGLEEDEMED